MKQLGAIDEQSFTKSEIIPAEMLSVRKASRVIMRDADGKIALTYYQKTGQYKLPGGGIEAGESIDQAAHREVMEETGYVVKNLHTLGFFTEARHSQKMFQISYLLTADITGEFSAPQPTDEECASGISLVWCDSVDDALHKIDSQHLLTNAHNAIFEMMKNRETTQMQYYKERCGA